MFTFAIVGHNEEETVGAAVRQARAAAEAGDRVVFVDSASTDATADVARRAGAEVLPAPLGKGAAMAAIAETADTEWICFLDADMVDTTHNIPGLLRSAATRTRADHVLGDFECGLGVTLSNTIAVYQPLIAALFPEIDGKLGGKPLTGFRGVRRGFLPAGLPSGYGVEAAVNIRVAMSGGRSVVQPVGRYTGKVKRHPSMGQEIAETVLAAAEQHGRIAASARPAWQAWVAGVLTLIEVGGVDAGDERYRERLRAAASRPLPPTGVTARAP